MGWPPDTALLGRKRPRPAAPTCPPCWVFSVGLHCCVGAPREFSAPDWGVGHRHMQRGQPRGHVLIPVQGFSLASAEAAGAGSSLRVGADLGVCRQRGTAGPRVPGRAGDTSLPARCHRGAAAALVAGCRPAALTTGSPGPSPRQRGEARGGPRCTRTCCLIAGDWQLLVISPPGRDVGGR